MTALTCDISELLIDALAARSARTGERQADIVTSALADALEIERSTLFQVSTSTALVEGVYDGVVSVGELKQHGDFGLGTFDALDGELVAMDGRFYQVHGSGEVSEAPNEAKVPFAVITAFRAERSFVIDYVADFDELVARLDRERRTDNRFYAARIEGCFAHVQTRAARRANTGVSLVDATARQSVFELSDVEGSLVGFWTPSYARTINIAGWHLHFLAESCAGGGHLLDCRTAGLRVELQELAEVRIAMPETAAFMKADLTRDPSSDLDVAERGGRRPG
ncbi:MAG TPA: acetolactate decarboxylase [Labilithrix sp.]|nr:acetolactate decarboxylase [Labilithrix sp.]